MRPYNEEFANQIRNNLIEEAPDMAEEAAKMVEAVGVPVAPQVPTALAVPVDLGRLPTADNVAAALRSRVNGKRVADLFEQQGRLLMSDWMRSNERAINNVVTKGIMDAAPTKDIAKGIVEIIQRQGQEYISTAGPTAARKIQSDAKAIARTAVQDANRQVHEQVWEANESALSDLKWEWVAALDARTCPICAPLDGQRWDTRQEAPQWPAHINCRCQVVAVDPDEAADVRSGIVIRDDKPYVGDRAYKTKVKVDGEKYYRKAVDIKPIKGAQVTYGDFLHSSNQLTREKFFGSKAKANRFMDLVDKRSMDPRTALKRLVDEGKFKPDSRLGKLPAVKVNKPKAKAAPKPKPKPAPKPEPAPATVVANKAEEKALAKLSTQMGTAELDAAMKAVDTKVIAKAKPSAVTDVKGINPVSLFNNSKNTLGRGAFGEARLTSKGVVKRGWLNRTELTAMEKLGDTGVTPKLLGSAFEGDWKPNLFPGMNVRRGHLLMEKAPGEPLQKLIQFGGGLTEKQGARTFESLMNARKNIHLSGVAHQDMHPGNILLDLKSEKLTVIDLGMARVDSRAALVEALGTGRGRQSFGTVEQAGDYQSRSLFSYLNKLSGISKSETWKRFQRNRKSVIEKLIAEGAGDTVNASIRKLPRSVTSNLTTKRALELLEELYEGI